MEQGNLTFQVFYVAVNNPRLDKPNWRLAPLSVYSGSPKSKPENLWLLFLWMTQVSLSCGFAFYPSTCSASKTQFLKSQAKARLFLSVKKCDRKVQFWHTNISSWISYEYHEECTLFSFHMTSTESELNFGRLENGWGGI